MNTEPKPTICDCEDDRHVLTDANRGVLVNNKVARKYYFAKDNKRCYKRVLRRSNLEAKAAKPPSHP